MITGMEGFENLQMMMIRAEYPKVNHYLHEEKQKHLESLAVEGKIVFNQLWRNVARMRHRRKPLRKMYEELKEICCKTDVDLNQDFGDLMKRSPLMQLHIPQPVNPQLSSQTITGMSERLNNFQDLSFAVEPNDEEQLINLSKVSGILIAG
ncbi:tripartite motif-containing protein 77 isoform X2 [Mustela lutreola]|uniref:tripartite motif-containing protein 77 isoform X2 n=1 Tax=Mustela lutreola TaxID=9666 RepID=UPI0027970780|nr:tripartite motif-containing protein 77 isoform X2 [Mustela lutreola]